MKYIPSLIVFVITQVFICTYVFGMDKNPLPKEEIPFFLFVSIGVVLLILPISFYLTGWVDNRKVSQSEVQK